MKDIFVARMKRDTRYHRIRPSGSIWSNEMVFLFVIVHWMQRPSPQSAVFTGYDGHHKDYYSWWIYTSHYSFRTAYRGTQKNTANQWIQNMHFWLYRSTGKFIPIQLLNSRKIYNSIPAVFINTDHHRDFVGDQSSWKRDALDHPIRKEHLPFSM